MAKRSHRGTANFSFLWSLIGGFSVVTAALLVILAIVNSNNSEATAEKVPATQNTESRNASAEKPAKLEEVPEAQVAETAEKSATEALESEKPSEPRLVESAVEVATNGLQSGNESVTQAIEPELPRFIDQGDYIEDTVTGLLWQKDSKASGKLNFYEAEEYAEDLELGGLSDWRVPTRKEITELFDLDEMPFDDITPPTGIRDGVHFWTSELDTRLDDYAYIYAWYGDRRGTNNCYASKNFSPVKCVHDPVEKDEDRKDEDR